METRTYQRRKIVFTLYMMLGLILFLIGRMIYLMVVRSEHYTERAKNVQERERTVQAERGTIYDRNGTMLAINESVCTISVIHNQIKDKEQVIRVLCEELDLSEEYVRKRVEKVSSIEKIKSNVEIEIGDRIRNYNFAGVKVDEDYKKRGK